jgi:ADP-heptose:LPS heptosyltransferase
MGDVLWAEPVIRALAKDDRKLVVYTKYPELFENFPFKKVIFKKDLNSWEKALIRIEDKLNTHVLSLNLDNTYELEPMMHMLHAYQQKADLPLTQEYPKLYLSNSEKNSPIISGDYVVLHIETFSERNYRQVHGVHWNEVVSYFITNNLKVVQVGVNIEPLKNTIVKKTSIRELISIIHHSKLFIGLDSGPSHIAASLGVTAMIFFGAVNPLFRHFPKIFKGVIMQQPCEFAGCYHEITSDIKGPICKLVGNSGIPKCSLHKTDFVISNIEQLLQKHAAKNY